MMIHTENTPATLAAVVRAGRFDAFAFRTVFHVLFFEEFNLSIRDVQARSLR